MFLFQQASFGFHILGLIFWLGGLIALSRVLRIFTVAAEDPAALSAAGRESALQAARALWGGFVLGGLAIVLATGLVQIFLIGLGYYMQQGWFHTKLTGVVVLLGITGYAGLQMTKLGRGEVLPRKALAAIHGGTSGLAVVVLLITYLGRGIS